MGWGRRPLICGSDDDAFRQCDDERADHRPSHRFDHLTGETLTRSPRSLSAVSNTRLPAHAPFCSITNNAINAKTNKNTRCRTWPPNCACPSCLRVFIDEAINEMRCAPWIAQICSPPANALFTER